MIIFRIIKKQKPSIRFGAFCLIAVCFAAGIARAQSGQICTPNIVSGCKVCNFAGTDWINDNLKCASGQICVDGECVANCQNECQLAGIKECYAGGYRVCVDNKSTGCLHWSGIFPCSSIETCIGGICVKNQNMPAGGIALSNFSPFGTINEKNTTLKIASSVAANCRYDFLDRDFNLMANSFATSNYLIHTAPLVLEKTGDYVYYVRCRDKSGNIAAGKIGFTYALEQEALVKETKTAPQVVETPPDSDKKPPVILTLDPSGAVDFLEVELSLSTDEAAWCNYDIFDTDYESMENSMIAGAGGMVHRHKIILAGGGKYTYYVRCKDNAGNKNESSAKISFEYDPAKTVSGPKIANLSPDGTIYQNELVLIIATETAAECRYDSADTEFDLMVEKFATADKFLHEAAVSLPDYGRYDYFARCKDESGAINNDSVAISFEYRDPGVNAAQNSSNGGCAEYSLYEQDGNCDYRQDCVCDPDCKKTGGYDPDCDYIAAPQKNTRPLILSGAVIFGILAAAAIGAFIFKKNKKSSIASTDESQFLG
jgi:hypothetical protein